MADQKTSRGFSGALVKLWRGGDYEMTVTGRTEITPNYLRLHFTAKKLLTERAIHPTMWVRGWFPDGAKSHQRGYTLVNPDPEAGTGILGLRDRAEAAGGTLFVISPLGRGTTVTVALPLTGD